VRTSSENPQVVAAVHLKLGQSLPRFYQKRPDMAPVAIHSALLEVLLSRYVLNRCPAKQRLVDLVAVRVTANGARTTTSDVA